jgi:metallophosphoesterase (TIGR00282 family)
VLALGDVCGDCGIDFVCSRLPELRRELSIDFCVVNGENSSMLGITPSQADTLFSHGANVVTLGNHAFARREITSYLEGRQDILRPANISPVNAGFGWGVYDLGRVSVAVIALIGRISMDPAENPFLLAEKLLEEPKIAQCAIKLVELHAEATSEKTAMGYFLDGRVTVVWGTHTHVQTSDARVLPEGTGTVCDIGMCGAQYSVIGSNAEAAVRMFLGHPREKFVAAEGKAKLEGAVITADTASGKCVSIETIRINE